MTHPDTISLSPSAFVEAPLHPAEGRRLARLHALGALEADASLDDGCRRIAELARRIADVPMAAVSLVDAERQVFRGAAGLGVCGTGRRESLCSHTILGEGPMVVEDAWSDARFARNPLVLGPPHIRFYAGAPIVVDGLPMGAVCIIDQRPRSLSPEQAERLGDCAALAGSLFTRAELHRHAASAHEARAGFLSVLGHEMRTPIGAVLGFLDMLAEPGTSPADRAECETVIRRNATRLLALTEDLLELVRLESGSAVPSHTLSCPERILRELLAEYARAAALKSVGFAPRLRVDPDLVVCLDARHLRRCVAHLVDNALKFTDAGGAVEVEAWCEPCAGQRAWTLHVRVTDSGIGLPPGNPERLFRPFEVGDASHSRRFGGIGTGLTIARHLARANGGDVGLRRREGQGTIAEISFVATEATDGG